MLAAKEKTFSPSPESIFERMDSEPSREPATAKNQNQPVTKTSSPTVINRISNYDFRARKFKKSPIGSTVKIRCIVVVENQQPYGKTLGQNAPDYDQTHWPPEMSLYRGYFVPRATDPLGLLTDVDISVGFPEDAVTRCSSAWNWCITDVDFTVDPNNPDWSELEKWVDSLPADDCIGNIIFNGHGSPGSAGPLNSGSVTNPKSDVHKVLSKLKGRMCKDSRVDLRHCLCAKGKKGQKFLSNLSITIGAPVRGIDDIYAVNPHGDEYEALPDGTISKICSHGAYKDSWICAWQNGVGGKGKKPNKPKLKPRKCQKDKPDIMKPTLPHPFK